MARAKAKKVEPAYKLSLKIMNETYTGEGATPEEALDNFQTPFKVLKFGELTFEHDGKSKVVRLSPIQIKSLKMKIRRMYLLNNFTFGLK